MRLYPVLKVQQLILISRRQITKASTYCYACEGCLDCAPFVPSSVYDDDESDAGSLQTAKQIK